MQEKKLWYSLLNCFFFLIVHNWPNALSNLPEKLSGMKPFQQTAASPDSTKMQCNKTLPSVPPSHPALLKYCREKTLKLEQVTRPKPRHQFEEHLYWSDKIKVKPLRCCCRWASNQPKSLHKPILINNLTVASNPCKCTEEINVFYQ